MSETISVRMDRETYRELQDFAYRKHNGFRYAGVELTQAVKEYLERQEQPS